jgi:hypothetical protein
MILPFFKSHMASSAALLFKKPARRHPGMDCVLFMRCPPSVVNKRQAPERDRQLDSATVPRASRRIMPCNLATLSMENESRPHHNNFLFENGGGLSLSKEEHRGPSRPIRIVRNNNRTAYPKEKLLAVFDVFEKIRRGLTMPSQ